MKVFNNTAYGLAIGVVRALEAKLIKDDDFSRLRACRNVEEFGSELKNLNYFVDQFSNSIDFNFKLNSYFNKVVFELKENCPPFAPFNLIFFENDCFNLKTIIFLKRKNANVDDFALKPGLLSKASIESYCSGCCVLPSPFFELAIELDRLLDLNCSNFEILNQFNKKQFELKLGLSKTDEFLFKRAKLEVDLHNCRLVLRALKLNLNDDNLNEVLVPGGEVDLNLILEAFSKGVDHLTKLFKLAWAFNLENMLSNFDLAEDMFFKKISDFDFKTSCLPFSFSAVLAYLNKLQWEHRNLKHILTKLIFLGG